MRAMLLALIAIIVISVGAGYALNAFGPDAGRVSDSVRVGD